MRTIPLFGDPGCQIQDAPAAVPVRDACFLMRRKSEHAIVVDSPFAFASCGDRTNVANRLERESPLRWKAARRFKPIQDLKTFLQRDLIEFAPVPTCWRNDHLVNDRLPLPVDIEGAKR